MHIFKLEDIHMSRHAHTCAGANSILPRPAYGTTRVCTLLPLQCVVVCCGAFECRREPLTFGYGARIAPANIYEPPPSFNITYVHMYPYISFHTCIFTYDCMNADGRRSRRPRAYSVRVNLWQCVAVCCSMLQCVAVCCMCCSVTRD